ncbi:MAG TPA: hypothetical protein VG982_02815, partial [Candidatus Paceibacterota bacterium]|nr:hypothetical protein [Candidatus Paceibacterota bacterium]
DPLALIDTFTMIGPSKIIFHIETLDNDMVMHFFDTLPEITRQTIRFELAFGVESDVSVILPYMESIDSIQCMGISRVGFQGQAFDPRVIDQIKKLRELYPEKTIAVDGGVNEETIASLARAGVTEFVVGSAIFGNDDPRGTIERLKTRCNAAFTA